MKTKKVLLLTAVFLFIITLMAIIPNKVFAAEMSAEFKSILNEEGQLEITDTNLGDKYQLIHETLLKYSNENYNYSFSYYEDYTKAIIIRTDFITNEVIESHEVPLVFNEKYSEEFKKVAKDGKIVITDSGFNGKQELVGLYCMKISNENINYTYYMEADTSVCALQLLETRGDITYIKEQHKVDITYKEEVSDEFKKILKDGKVVITDSTQAEEKSDLLMGYCNNFSNEQISFSYGNIKEDGSACIIQMYKIENGYHSYEEQHVVPLVYEEKISDEFKNILKDGKMLLPNTTENLTEEWIENYIFSFSNEKYHFNIDTYYDMDTFTSSKLINEDFTEATIVMSEKQGFKTERHIVKLEKLTEPTEQFKKYLNKEGKLEINSIKPINEDEFYTLFEVLIWDGNQMMCTNIAKDFSSCDLTVNYETHNVEIVYNYDNSIKEKLQTLVDNFPKNKQYFKVEDMELINYWINTVDNDDINTFAGYSGELKSYINNYNVKLKVHDGAGYDEPFTTGRLGMAAITHNDVAYYVNPMLGTEGKHIIYVPDTTGNSKEELIAAAQKRINEYLGNDKIVKVSYGGTAKDAWIKASYELTRWMWEEDEPNLSIEEWMNGYFPAYEDFGRDVMWIDGVNENDDTFIVTVKVGNKEKSHNILIKKDSSKMITPTHATADMITDIEVNSTSSSIPLDTSIKAEELTSGTEYERIIKILDVEENAMFDLKLYSDSLEDYITKLENGFFEVKLPIPEKLEGKTLIVYYVDANGKITEHEVTVKDGFAIFTTDHFSIYTLAEMKKKENDQNNNTGNTTGGKGEGEAENSNNAGTNGNNNNNTGNTNNNNNVNNSNNPQTGDNIMFFVGMLFIAVIGIAITTILKKHHKTK